MIIDGKGMVGEKVIGISGVIQEAEVRNGESGKSVYVKMGRRRANMIQQILAI